MEGSNSLRSISIVIGLQIFVISVVLECSNVPTVEVCQILNWIWSLTKVGSTVFTKR